MTEETLRDLRRRTHETCIKGNSEMSEDQLKDALNRVRRDEDPVEVKRRAHGWEDRRF